MEVIAISKSVNVSPRKVRLVADSIKNMSIADAFNALSVLEKRSALPLEKTIRSSLSNAINNAKLLEENLYIKRIEISGGPALKRFHPSTRGRVHPYKKRTSHIKVIVEDKGTK